MIAGQAFSEIITALGNRRRWVCTKDSIDVEINGILMTVWSGANGIKEEVFYCNKGCEKTLGFQVIGEAKS